MSPLLLVTVLLALSAIAYWQGKRRAMSMARQPSSPRLHASPGYYGMLTALWCGLPALCIVLLWKCTAQYLLLPFVMEGVRAAKGPLSPDQISLLTGTMRNLLAGTMPAHALDPVLQKAAIHYQELMYIANMAVAALALSSAIIAGLFAHSRIRPALRARVHVERMIKVLLALSSTVAIIITTGIVLSILYESIRFFQHIPVWDFLFGLKWSPQIAIRPDQIGSSGSFGAVPVLTGTLLIAAIAMTVALPLGLLSAIYLSEYAGRKFRAIVRPLLEILAGIPTVVYGFFAAIVVAPVIHRLGLLLGWQVSSESALAAGLVMGLMIVPFISSLIDDVLKAVPQPLRESSYSLGATRSETIKRVVLPAAFPGIVGAFLLAVSRALGETMIVVMAAGLAAHLTLNPLQSVTTVTVQIVSLLTGAQAFDSPKTMAAFALGMLLFVVTLGLNLIALYVVRRYRKEAY